jgi:predicted Fe-S protein YdhL (DUF1289 family)
VLVTAAQQALMRAEAGEAVAAAIDPQAIGQAWRSWADYQERMAYWGDRLPGWRTEYTRAVCALLGERLVPGAQDADQRTWLPAARWQRLLDDHRHAAMTASCFGTFDQMYAALDEHALRRQGCVQAIAALDAADRAWLEAELAGDRQRRFDRHREFALRDSALQRALDEFETGGRCASSLARHPNAAPERVAAVHAAMAHALEACQRVRAESLAWSLAELDRAQLEEEQAEVAAEVQALSEQARKAADAVTAVLEDQ